MEKNAGTLDGLSELGPESEADASSGPFPRGLAIEVGVLPVKREGRTWTVLADDRLDEEGLARLKWTLGEEVEVWPVPTEVLRGAMREAYGEHAIPELDGLLDAVSRGKGKRSLGSTRVGLGFAKRPTNVIAITSGKGGVGKTSLTANLGVALAGLGFQVAMIDADYGLANLHVLLGMKPGRTLTDVLLGSCNILDALCVGPEGVHLLAGSASLDLMSYDRLVKAGAGFDSLRGVFDFVLVDTAAGIHRGVTSLLEAVDETLLVMTQDPASIHDAYVTAKTLHSLRPDSTISCIVNQARNESDARKVFAKFSTVFSNATNRRSHLLGSVRADSSVTLASLARSPFVVSAARGRAAQDVRAIANSLASVSVHAPACSGLKGLLQSVLGKGPRELPDLF